MRVQYLKLCNMIFNSKLLKQQGSPAALHSHRPLYMYLSIVVKTNRLTVVLITPLICMKVVPISSIIGKTVLRIASATGIGYQHDRSMRFS